MGAGEPGQLGALLRQYRIAAGLTQEELAARAQVSARSISDLERGLQRVPYPSTIRRLKIALDLTPDEGARFQAAAQGVHTSSPTIPQPASNGQHADALPFEAVETDASRGAREVLTQSATVQDEGRMETRRVEYPRLGAVAALLVLAALGMYSLWGMHSSADTPLVYTRIPTWGESVFDAERLGEPDAIATDAGGSVFVADGKADRIFRFSASGAFLGAWGTSGSGAGELRHPTALAIDSHGMVYIADTGNDRVEKFTASGRLVAMWGSTGSRRGQFRVPDGIAVDAQGFVYVSDYLNERIQVLAPDGHVAAVFKDSGFPSGEIPPYHIVSPGPLAMDASGTLYVVDYGDHAVIVLPRAASLGMQAGFYLDTSAVQSPVAVAVDAKQYIYVVDAGHVLQFQPSGALPRRWDRKGARPHLLLPSGPIAVAPHGDIYLADSTTGRVERFSPSGDFVSGWGPRIGRTIVQPQAVTVGANGTVYVADSVRDRLFTLSASGRLLSTWGSRGARPGQFDEPSGLTTDSSGNVYVADTSNDRVQVLSPHGKVKFVWVPSDEGPGGPARTGAPTALAWDSGGRMYILDSFTNQLQVFTDRGNYTGLWGHLGFGTDLTAGEICCVAVDRRHNVYVGDERQGKISILSSAGALLRQWNAPGVKGLAVDGAGRVYVAGDGRVTVYSSRGTQLDTISRPGTAPAQPTTVALAPDDSLYVGDASSHSIYKFVLRRPVRG